MLKKLVFAIIFLIIVSVGGWFYYQKYINEFSFLQDDITEVVFAENIVGLNPYSFTESDTQRLQYIYEPLVKFDSNLNIQPALASSFGRIDELTWEFSLNPNAKFHDGTPLTADIVLYNFLEFKKYPAIKSLIDSIDQVTKIDDLTVKVTTKYPDASFLNKVALLYIVPQLPIADLEINPIGTGPYLVKRIQENKISLLANPDYYGRQPKFPKLVLTAITDQFERINYSLDSDRVVMVYPVAAGFTSQIPVQKFNLVRYPTTSVNFFLFNFNRPVFQNVAVRRFMNRVISDEVIAKLTDQLGKPVSQYVAEGVFGYDESIKIEKFASRDAAIDQVRALGIAGLEFKIALPKGLEVFKEVLASELEDIALLPTIDIIEPNLLTATSTLRDYDLVFLGWKSDYGDATSFLQSFAVSDGGLNSFEYSNSEVDNLVSQAQRSIDEQDRLQKLRAALRIISVQDPIGIPLFESETIYAVSKKYKYTPRFDGLLDTNNLSPVN